MEPSRPTGILTSNQREYLQGEKEYQSARAEEQATVRLRRRLRNAFMDCSLLFTSLDEDDLTHIFSPEPQTNEDQWAVIDGSISLLALCSVGFGKAGVPFNLAIDEAITRAETYRGLPVSEVKVDIETEYNQPRDPHKAIGGTVTIQEEDFPERFEEIQAEQKELLDELVESGAVTPDDLLQKDTVPEVVDEWAEERGYA